MGLLDVNNFGQDYNFAPSTDYLGALVSGDAMSVPSLALNGAEVQPGQANDFGQYVKDQTLQMQQPNGLSWYEQIMLGAQSLAGGDIPQGGFMDWVSQKSSDLWDWMTTKPTTTMTRDKDGNLTMQSDEAPLMKALPMLASAGVGYAAQKNKDKELDILKDKLALEEAANTREQGKYDYWLESQKKSDTAMSALTQNNLKANADLLAKHRKPYGGILA